MGQNMVGVPRITLSGETAGKEIKLRFAEVTYPDLPEFRENNGMIMLFSPLIIHKKIKSLNTE